MSLLVVGLSHRTAPVSVLERAALGDDARAGLLHDALAAEPAAEAAVLATCNRVELYADVDRFHAGVAELSTLLARHSGVPLEELTPHLYVHYEDRAVHHLLSVACGLDSMVVGEGQILGQIKDALALGQELHTAGRLLNDLFQQALRVGKRAHSETGIDRAGQSLVTFGLDRLAPATSELAGRRALVVGAGSMSSLAAATLARAGVRDLVIANRTVARAERLARLLAEQGADARAITMAEVPAALAAADLVVSCTGATGLVLTAAQLSAATADRVAAAPDRTAPDRTDADAANTAAPAEDPAPRPLAVLDLAMPRDVEAAAHDLPGVHLVDIEALAAASADAPMAADVDQVRAIVAEEVTAFGAAQRAARITPTVIALRAMAADVVAGELARLDGRLPGLDGKQRAEVAQTVRRVVDKLLHAPTVRVKQLAGEPGGAGYADALRELFDLDPQTVAAVSRAERAPAAAPGGQAAPPAQAAPGVAAPRQPARAATPAGAVPYGIEVHP